MKELEIVDQLPVAQIAEKNVAIESEKAEAIARTQSSFVIAKRFPRNEQESIRRITESCKRASLAKVGLYSYPRGGQTIIGPSIRLAEVLAQSWGNLDFGMRELENVEGMNGYSVVEAYCSDLETNVHQRRVFTVYHKMKLKNGTSKRLTDPRDVYEHVANYGSRRVRASILGVIPRDVVERAVEQIKETLRKGDGEPLIDRVNKMVLAFSDVGVSVEMIQKRVGHEVKDINQDELIELRAIYTSLKDGETKRKDWFELGESNNGGIAEAIKERTRVLQQEPT